MRQNRGVSIEFATSAMGHSRPARAGTKPGHVRYAPIAIKFRSEAKCRDVPVPDVRR